MRQFTKKAIKGFLISNFGTWIAESLAAFVMISFCLWPPPEFTGTPRIFLAVLVFILIALSIIFSIRSYRSELWYFQRHDKEYCHEHERLCPDAHEDILKNYDKFYKREEFLKCPKCKKALRDLYAEIDKIISTIPPEPSK